MMILIKCAAINVRLLMSPSLEKLRFHPITVELLVISDFQLAIFLFAFQANMTGTLTFLIVPAQDYIADTLSSKPEDKIVSIVIIDIMKLMLYYYISCLCFQFI